MAFYEPRKMGGHAPTIMRDHNPAGVSRDQADNDLLITIGITLKSWLHAREPEANRRAASSLA